VGLIEAIFLGLVQRENCFPTFQACSEWLRSSWSGVTDSQPPDRMEATG
jgi:hypothetical protein